MSLATELSLRSITARERTHRGNVELANVLDSVVDELARLRAELTIAENERTTAREALYAANDASESLRADNERLLEALLELMRHFDDRTHGGRIGAEEDTWRKATNAVRAAQHASTQAGGAPSERTYRSPNIGPQPGEPGFDEPQAGGAPEDSR